MATGHTLVYGPDTISATSTASNTTLQKISFIPEESTININPGCNVSLNMCSDQLTLNAPTVKLNAFGTDADVETVNASPFLSNELGEWTKLEGNIDAATNSYGVDPNEPNWAEFTSVFTFSKTHTLETSEQLELSYQIDNRGAGNSIVCISLVGSSRAIVTGHGTYTNPADQIQVGTTDQLIGTGDPTIYGYKFTENGHDASVIYVPAAATIDGGLPTGAANTIKCIISWNGSSWVLRVSSTATDSTAVVPLGPDAINFNLLGLTFDGGTNENGSADWATPTVSNLSVNITRVPAASLTVDAAAGSSTLQGATSVALKAGSSASLTGTVAFSIDAANDATSIVGTAASLSATAAAVNINAASCFNLSAGNLDSGHTRLYASNDRIGLYGVTLINIDAGNICLNARSTVTVLSTDTCINSSSRATIVSPNTQIIGGNVNSNITSVVALDSCNASIDAGNIDISGDSVVRISGRTLQLGACAGSTYTDVAIKGARLDVTTNSYVRILSYKTCINSPVGVTITTCSTSSGLPHKSSIDINDSLVDILGDQNVYFTSCSIHGIGSDISFSGHEQVGLLAGSKTALDLTYDMARICANTICLNSGTAGTTYISGSQLSITNKVIGPCHASLNLGAGSLSVITGENICLNAGKCLNLYSGDGTNKSHIALRNHDFDIASIPSGTPQVTLRSCEGDLYITTSDNLCVNAGNNIYLTSSFGRGRSKYCYAALSLGTDQSNAYMQAKRICLDARSVRLQTGDDSSYANIELGSANIIAHSTCSISLKSQQMITIGSSAAYDSSFTDAGLAALTLNPDGTASLRGIEGTSVTLGEGYSSLDLAQCSSISVDKHGLSLTSLDDAIPITLQLGSGGVIPAKIDMTSTGVQVFSTQMLALKAEVGCINMLNSDLDIASRCNLNLQACYEIAMRTPYLTATCMQSLELRALDIILASSADSRRNIQICKDDILIQDNGSEFRQNSVSIHLAACQLAFVSKGYNSCVMTLDGLSASFNIGYPGSPTQSSLDISDYGGFDLRSHTIYIESCSSDASQVPATDISINTGIDNRIHMRRCTSNGNVSMCMLTNALSINTHHYSIESQHAGELSTYFYSNGNWNKVASIELSNEGKINLSAMWLNKTEPSANISLNGSTSEIRILADSAVTIVTCHVSVCTLSDGALAITNTVFQNTTTPPLNISPGLISWTDKGDATSHTVDLNVIANTSGEYTLVDYTADNASIVRELSPNTLVVIPWNNTDANDRFTIPAFGQRISGAGGRVLYLPDPSNPTDQTPMLNLFATNCSLIAADAKAFEGDITATQAVLFKWDYVPGINSTNSPVMLIKREAVVEKAKMIQ